MYDGCMYVISHEVGSRCVTMLPMPTASSASATAASRATSTVARPRPAIRRFTLAELAWRPQARQPAAGGRAANGPVGRKEA